MSLLWSCGWDDREGGPTWWWRGQHFAVLKGAQLACLGPCLLCTEGFELGSEGLVSTGSLITRHHGERTASSPEHLRSSNASFLWWLLPAVGDVQALTAFFGGKINSSLVYLFFLHTFWQLHACIDCHLTLLHYDVFLDMWFCCCYQSKQWCLWKSR